MNLFRSEEHARNWSGWKDEAAAGLLPVGDMMTIFSAPIFRERLSGRYISAFAELRKTFLETVQRVTAGNPFWRVSPP